jgi:hypothetical protein
MSVAKSKFIAEQVNNTFWKTSFDPKTLIGIRLYNDQPYSNYNYPYQLQFTFYSAGYVEYADTIQQLGGVDLLGGIAYSGWTGQLVDTDTIVWQGIIGGNPIIWKKVDLNQIPAQPQKQTRAQQVYQFDKDFSGTLHQLQTDAYGSYIGFKQ